MTKTTKRSRSEVLVTSSEVQQNPSKRYVKWTTEHDRILVNYVKENPFNRQKAFRKTSEDTGHSIVLKKFLDYEKVKIKSNTIST